MALHNPREHGQTMKSEPDEDIAANHANRWWCDRVAAVILVAHVGLLARGAWIHSPCYDEWAHLPAGLSHWETGQFDLYRVNPPLVRVLAAVPLLFCDVDMEWPPLVDDPRARPEWEAARRFVDASGKQIFWYFTLARWVCIPLSVLGGWTCLQWARDLYGGAAGLTALALWCFSPVVLAHAQMITPDAAAGSLGIAAAYLFWRWLRQPCLTRALAAGLVLGLAELTKSIWVVLFGLWPVLWLVWRVFPPSKANLQSWKQSTLHMAVILAAALYVINAGYAFEGTGRRLGDFRFACRTLRCGSERLPGEATDSENRFASSWAGGLPVLLPANYLLGIDRQKSDFESGAWSYLQGQWRFGGWWYYYVYALAVKEPLGTLILMALALTATIFLGGFLSRWPDELMLLIPILTVLTLVSSQTGFNHHLRYVLPMFPFAFIWTSKIARSAMLGHRSVAVAAAAALAWSVGSSLYHYPHSLSYFNELVGGSKHGHEHLLNSNIDWGQDLLFLKRWLGEHPEVAPIGLAYSVPEDVLDPADVGIEYTLPPPGPGSAPPFASVPPSQLGPVPGWYAIFVCAMWDTDRHYAYFEHFEPVEMLGYTVRIYHISLNDANRVRRKLGLSEIHESESPRVEESKSLNVSEVKS
jgi:hypothetical protein